MSGLRYGTDEPNGDAPPAGDDDKLAGLDDYLRECVRIDPLRIQDEFVRIPADLAYWNARYADAQRAFLMAKIDLDVIKAKLGPLTRRAIADKGGKATEDLIKNMVESHADVIDAREQLAVTEVEKSRLYGCLDAIRSKKEMLISLGAHMRAEMEGDPSLRQQARHAHGTDD